MKFDQFEIMRKTLEDRAIQLIQEGKLPGWVNERDRLPWFFALALAGETGELTEEVKKALRESYDDLSNMTDERRNRIILEAGDVLHYLSQFMTSIGSSLEEVVAKHIEHVEDRIRRDTNA